MTTKKSKLVIIDGNALVHRAWHALPPTLTTKNGEMVNAVYGFTMILLKVLKDLKPNYLTVTFDLKAPTFRHEQYAQYKATRVKQPDELYAQLPRIKQVVEAFDIPIYEKEGFEADDVIATVVSHPQTKDLQKIIVTGDLDTLQLVNNDTSVYTTHKGISDTLIYDEAQIKQRFGGLTPEQMVDFKALRGDPSDNIPGVKGIGEKGAINLLTEFKTLNNLYQNLSSPKIPDRYRDLLKQYKDDALMSQGLCQLQKNVAINFKLPETKVASYDVNKVIPLFQELEFKSLISKLPKETQKGSVAAQGSFVFSVPGVKAKQGAKKVSYNLVGTQQDFEKFLKQLRQQKIIAIDTETSGLDPFNNELLGVSFCWQDGLAYYLPAKSSWLKTIKEILENPEIKKIGHNIKFDLETLNTAGIKLAGLYFDTMVASYLTNPGSRQHNLDNLVFTELGYQMQPITDLIGKGKSQISLKDVPLQQVADYSCEDADFTWRLVALLTQQLKEKSNLGLFEKIEMPLIEVLAAMERNGVLIDTISLKKMAKEINSQLNKLKTKINQLAGTKFNVASPLQLKEILFEKLKISTQGLGKTKTGISTAADQLEKLKGKHKIIDYIISYRELAKLSSTYLEALPKLVNPHDGRVHTTYNQTITATGRLSSSDPNLQNIPVRTALGQKIRQAFIAQTGFSILSADYSQIELRIIASLANDKKMIESFKNGEDIHTRTAAEINEVPLDKVTKQMRYEAKAINFGIIYGQGPRGLAQGAGISFDRAADFIDRYFLLHQQIQAYLEETKKLAHSAGYVETWFGRRRYLPEINSKILPIKAAAERMAINHPIQGTAADLMKLAMIEVAQGLSKISPQTKMIMQVHDELVFEVSQTEIKKVANFIKEAMEGVYKLRAPVETHVSIGKNWGALKSIN